MIRQFFSRLIPIALLVGGLLSHTAQAGPFSGIVVFGDSLSDSGNNATILAGDQMPTPIPGPGFSSELPYESGRYSNGPVWVEQVATALGLSAKDSLLGGSNYAFGGAQTGLSTSFPFGLLDQLSMFLEHTGGSAPSSALYVLAGGGNDALAALQLAANGGDPAPLLAGYAANTAQLIGTLIASGARDFLLVNVPDIGVTPALRALGPAAQGLGTSIAAGMNLALESLRAGFAQAPGVELRTLDLFSLLDDVFADPFAYGLADATHSCAAEPACIADPSKTLFWDGLHPTTAGHAVFAQAALAALGELPEPASLVLFGLGAIAALGLRRRRITAPITAAGATAPIGAPDDAAGDTGTPMMARG